MATLTPPIHGGHPPKLYSYFPECAWTNRMRVATLWAEYSGGSRTSLTLTDPRSDGYPGSLDPGLEARCVLMDGGHELAGSWTCKWDGDGTVTFHDDDGHTATGSDGAAGISITIGANYVRCHIIIADDTGALGNPVHNIRVYYTPYAAYLKTSEGGSSTYGFDPDFSARWRRSKQNAVRMSHWLEPFDSIITTAASRRPDNYYTESSLDDRNDETISGLSKGCSWKAITDFCNEFDVDYVNITTPHLTFDDLTDSWLEDITAYLVANLTSSTSKFIFSGANEVWNGFAFANVNAYLKDIGDNGHAGRSIAARVGVTQTDRLAQALARWCKHIFDVTKAIAPTRVLGMIDWQAAPSQSYFFPILTRILSNDAGTPITPARINYDIYSTSCYTGQYLINDHTNAEIGTWSNQQFSDYVRSDIDNRLFNGLPNECYSAAFYANDDGATWIAYEMGRHEETGLSGAARTGLYNYYRSSQCRVNVAYQCEKVRGISDRSGHGFWYHSMGFPFGLAEEWRDDGGSRPGSVGMNNEQSFLSWEEAGAIIMENTAPILTNPGNQSCTVGVPFSLQLSAFDPDVPPQVLRYTAQGLPAGLGCNSLTGLISGTPTLGGATVHVIATVDDGEGGIDTALFDITVNGVVLNDPPVLANPGPQSWTEGVAVNLQLSAVDPEGDPIQYGAIGLPTGLSCSLAGLISGTPAVGTSSGGSPPGYWTIFAQCRDNHNNVSNLVQFVGHVVGGAPNRPPVFPPITQLLVADEGIPFSYQLLATDPDGDPLQYYASVGSLPAGVTCNVNTGEVSGTPAVGTASPIFRAITFGVTDGRAQVFQQAFMLVRGGATVNHAPVITNPGTLFAFESISFRRDITVVDPDPGDTVQVTIGGMPAGLTYNDRDKVIEGVPNQGTGRVSPYTITITAQDNHGLAATPVQFDLYVFSRSVRSPLGNSDLYIAAQMVPSIGSSGLVGDRQISGCIGYEIGSHEVRGSSRLWDVVQTWWAYDYNTTSTKHLPLAETTSVIGGNWKFDLESNSRGGGVGWKLKVTDLANDPPLLSPAFNILTTGDGTGRSLGGDLTFNLAGDDDKLVPIRVSEDGALLGQGRVDSGSDWLGASAPAANRTPRWTHGSPLIKAEITRPASNRIDISTLSLPLDWNLTSGRGSGSSLVSPTLLGIEHRRLTRLNWPRAGIITTFSNYRSARSVDPATMWNIVQDVVGLHLHEGFDERWIMDGADNVPAWTNLSNTTLHSQFTSIMPVGVTEHFHMYQRGRSYLLAILATTNWPAGYNKVGVEVSVNITGLGVTNALIPAIADQTARKGVVVALGAGAVTLQIDVTDLVTLAPPLTSNGLNSPGLTYTGGTFTVPALKYHYPTGAADSFILKGLETVGTEAGRPPGQAASRLFKNLITDSKGACAMVLKCTGANTRAVPGYAFSSDFSVGVGFCLIGDDINPANRVNSSYTYLGSSRWTPATFQYPGTDKATAYQKIVAGIAQFPEQQVGSVGKSNLFRGVATEGLIDPDLDLQLPAYIAIGTFAEVQAHMEWLSTNGWLNLPLPHTLYRSVQ